MAMPKKERFTNKGANIVLENVSAIPFPPEKITYDGKKLVLLGKSNKDDLFPPTLQERDLILASTRGSIGQFIYSAENSDLYDVLLFVDEVENVILYSIRTRLL